MPTNGRPSTETPSRAQLVDRGRHQPLAAGLVDRSTARLDHRDPQPGPAGTDRDGEPDRTAAGDQDVRVGHAGRLGDSACSARSSAAIRVRSSTALATVNTAAVTQALCTSGRAKPSTTTAR